MSNDELKRELRPSFIAQIATVTPQYALESLRGLAWEWDGARSMSVELEIAPIKNF